MPSATSLAKSAAMRCTSMAWSAAAVMSGVFFGRRVLPHVMRTQQAVGVLVGAAVLATYLLLSRLRYSPISTCYKALSIY